MGDTIQLFLCKARASSTSRRMASGRDGTEKVTEQVRITPKGLKTLAKLIQPALQEVA